MLIRVSLHVGVSLLDSFFVGLLGLPVSFFSAGLVKSLVREVDSRDHIGGFLARRALGVAFTVFAFIIFSIILFLCSGFIFTVFLLKDILCNT